MIKLYEDYPNEIELDGKTVRLDLAYDRVLRALDLQDETALTPEDRLELQCALLLAEGEKVPQDMQRQAELLIAIFELFPKNERESRERFLDFTQDAGMIRSAFYRIGVDLIKDRPHFLKFLELLADLPSDTALMRTVQIRQMPLPQLTDKNKDQYLRIVEAKQRCAIKLSEEERRGKFARALKNSSMIKG